MSFILKKSCFLLLVLILSACGDKKVIPSTEMVNNSSLASLNKEVDVDLSAKVLTDLQTEILPYYRYPSLTLILVPKGDIQKSIEALIAGGGELIYDPNNRLGATVPFYLASLSPEQINDSSFMESLKLKAASLDSSNTLVKPVTTKLKSGSITPENFIPTKSVGIDSVVGYGETRESLGEDTVVAVIDTGVDASHPGFEGRVDYWYDATEEVQVSLKPVATSNLTFSLDQKVLELPRDIAKGEVFIASLKESDLAAQLSNTGKEEISFLDINLNKSSDVFPVIAVKTESGVKVYFDVDGDYKFSKKESKALIDYNLTTKSKRNLGMVEFPTRNSILKYPLLVEEKEDEIIIGLGKTGGMHGTHVAGIIAANDPENHLVGAAPKAKIMALKVCTQISCTDSAIIKALYKTFYNKKGLIPDVVNISLGSHEKYKKGVYSYILDDLSAKFGTIFFVSASNSGPGFRSLNHIGNTGAVVTVGANVSSKTLSDQYNLPGGSTINNENLLFFSSLGPSYTSEMKPNIVAPGAAISTVLTAEGYMSQANGTSMSSPLAAGAMAAIIGSLKKEDKSLFEHINSQRKLNKKRTVKSKRTLLPYVYGMRDALQKTAIELEDLTLAQQGYGLIDAGSAKSSLRDILTKLNSNESDYFEVVINNHKKSYERNTHALRQEFTLTLGLDGERTLKSKANILANGVDVKLAKIEIIGTNGKVQKMIADSTGLEDFTKFFSIIDQGNASNQKLGTHVTFNNRRTKSFYSKRNLANMKRGSTYIAHYKISYKGNTVQNILDVVHMPLLLRKQKISVPAIDPSLKSVAKGFYRKNVEIAQNTFHRYPLMIDSKMQSIDIKTAIDSSSSGLLYVQLYDPTGKEVSFKSSTNNSINGYNQASINVSTLKEGKVQAGIWELTISTSSSTWLSSSVYDLIVDTSSFGALKSEYTLKEGSSLEVPVAVNTNVVSKVIFESFEEVQDISVDVKSGHFSFYPIGDIEEDKVSLSIKYLKSSSNTYWGSIVPSLFVKEDGKFVKAENSFKTKTSGSRRIFTDIKSEGKKLYFALDTITNYSVEALGSKKRPSSVTVSKISKLSTQPNIEYSISNFLEHGLSLVKISYPNNLKMADKYISSSVRVISGALKETKNEKGETLIETTSKNKSDTFKLIIK